MEGGEGRDELREETGTFCVAVYLPVDLKDCSTAHLSADAGQQPYLFCAAQAANMTAAAEHETEVSMLRAQVLNLKVNI